LTIHTLPAISACHDFIDSGGDKFISPQHGVCYTFNFGPSYTNINLSSMAANINYGLTLEFDIESKT
jgi:hypothetical protein